MTTATATQVERRQRAALPPTTPFGRIAWLARRAADVGISWPSARYRQDPVAFACEVLGVEPWSKQVEILEAIRDHKRVAIRSGHKVSKSHTMAIAALWFFSSFEDARVVMTCVTARQVDEILYREVKKMHSRARVRLDGDPRELARSGIKASDFRELVGFTAKEAEAVAGVSGANLLYLVDEASGVPDEIFEAIEGNRAGGARLVMTSNPTRTEGEFFNAFEAKARFYHTVHVSSEDTPNVREGREVIPGLATREWVNEKREEWGEDSPLFRVRVRGEFVRHEEGKIISLHLLEQAEQRWPEAMPDGRLHIGIDPAGPGEGGDESAFSVRRGPKQLSLIARRALSEEAHVTMVLGLLREHGGRREQMACVAIDREGPIGSRIYGLLRAYLDDHPSAFYLIGVRSSDRAYRDPQLYDRVRDELWARLAEWMRADGAIVSDAKLAQELHAPKWASGLNGKLKATDKRELKKTIGRSPDRADALALSVWEPLSLTAEQRQAQPVAEPAHAAYEPSAHAAYEPSTDMSPYEPRGGDISPYGGWR